MSGFWRSAGGGGLNLAALPMPVLVARLSLMSIPTAVAMMAAMSYYSDFLKSQSPHFYDPSHIEEFDFIIGKLNQNTKKMSQDNL